jgi:hypothetical protein
MRTKKEIIERIEELIKYRNYLYRIFASVDVVEAEINALLWVLKE